MAHNRKNVAPCKEVPNEVKNEFIEYLKQGVLKKQVAQMNMEEMIETCSYFKKEGSQMAPISTRGIRGPIDRFVANVGGDDVHFKDMTATEMCRIPPKNYKEMRNKICMDIGRCFYKNALPFNLANSPFINMYRSIGDHGTEAS